jgi:hypothetical protein
MSAKVARDLRRRSGERDADIGGFQCRRVVDAVANHCDALPRALQIGDDAQLLRRRQPSEDAVRRRRRCSRAELVALDDRGLVLRRDADLRRDSERGGALVPGQHDRRDTGVPQHFDKLGGAAAQRVRHPDEPEPDELGNLASAILARRNSSIRDPEDAKPGRRHGEIVGLNCAACSRVYRALLPVLATVRAKSQHGHRIAFDRDQRLAVRGVVKRCHVAASGRALGGREAQFRIAHRIDLGAQRGGKFDQSGFRRGSRRRTGDRGSRGRVVAQHAYLDEPREIGILLAAHHGAIAPAIFSVGEPCLLPIPAQARHGHSVQRQSAGLVETDEIDRAQPFDRLNAPHQQTARAQPADAHRERRRDHRGQSLGHGGNPERDGGTQHQERGLAAQQTEDESKCRRRQRAENKVSAEPV